MAKKLSPTPSKRKAKPLSWLETKERNLQIEALRIQIRRGKYMVDAAELQLKKLGVSLDEISFPISYTMTTIQ